MTELLLCALPSIPDPPVEILQSGNRVIIRPAVPRGLHSVPAL
jgi:virulence-associated protein VagC